MLYADEEPKERALLYKCKICDYQERAQEGNEFENCVYMVDMEAKEMQLIINQDIISDPTLQKRMIEKCRNKTKACPNKEVVCFQHITQDRFDLIYVCTKCREWWRMNIKDPNYDINSEDSEEKNKDDD